MKTLIMKLGMRYRKTKVQHAALGEVDQISCMFTKIGHKTKIITKYNDMDEDYDILVVINGLVKPDMDEFNRAQYDFIDSFNGLVFFCYCDISLPLKRYSINRNDIVCLTQAINIPEIRKYINDNDNYNFKRIHYFPFYKFPIMTNDMYSNKIRDYDLLYGGGFRSGDRESDMIEFYFNNSNLDVAMFGNINKEMFSIPYKASPSFLKPVDYSMVCYTMSNAYATVVISDPIYKKTYSLTQRIYESIIAGCVTFIHEKVDPYHYIYGNDSYSKFLYVKSGIEVQMKISKLKKHSHIYDDIIKYARDKTGISNLSRARLEYIDNFTTFMNNHI